MKNYLKKTLLIAMLCMHNHSACSSQNSDNLSRDITRGITALASLVVIGTLYEIGTIYFKKYLNRTYGIQTTPDTPAVKVEQHIIVEQRIITDTSFNPYKLDNRSKKLKNPDLFKYNGKATMTQKSRRLNESLNFKSLPKIPKTMDDDLRDYLNYDLK